MIKSFKDKNTEKLYNGLICPQYALNLQKAALRKLKYLNNASDLKDLMIPPGNHLEALQGRAETYSIRVNIQWRITFTWNEGAENVALEDYH